MIRDDIISQKYKNLKRERIQEEKTIF